jgi:outer membrane immunogenic protein
MQHCVGTICNTVFGDAMKKLAIVIAVTGLIGTPAFAADMDVKAPPLTPAPVYNWTGWYVGVNAGASFGNVNTDFNASNITLAPVPLVTVPGNGGFIGSNRNYPDGFIGGGQIGYNWQYSPLIVVGFEADFQGAVERDNSILNHSGIVPFTQGGAVAPSAATALTDYTTQIDWFGTARARIGYVWGNGNVLSYVTGGLAYGKVKINGTNTVSGDFTPVGGPGVYSLTQAIGHSQVNTGWVMGYGTEGVIDFWGARNWTWKIEGLYMDLGHLDATGVTSVASVGGGFTSLTGGRSPRTAISPTASFAPG